MTRRPHRGLRTMKSQDQKCVRGASYPLGGHILVEVTLARAALWVDTLPYPWSTFIRRRGLSLRRHILRSKWAFL